MTLLFPDYTAHNLSEIIHQEIIRAGGFISFARFMELALYTPELGYYTSALPKFGKKGDFVTAPEISPLFSRCAAHQCKEILDELGKGTILEIGAGTGTFAKDILLELESLQQLPEHYYIYEISPELRRQQNELLSTYCSHLFSRIAWLDALPAKMDGIILANEVADALPVHCFRINESGIQERCVSHSNDIFSWLLTEPTTPLLTEQVTALKQEYALNTGYESEINLGLSTWVCSIASSLSKGVILLFDYGYGRAEYYHPERKMGTLMCYHQHQRHDDPFIWIGSQDITAQVDFTAVVESAYHADCTLAGYSTQAHFLLHCGLLELAEIVENTASITHANQAQVIKKLTLPSEMGELVKVMALSKNYTKPLCGFPQPDRRRDL